MPSTGERRGAPGWVLVVTVLAAVAVPTLAVMAGRIAAAPRTDGGQFLVVLALVTPLIGATFLVLHWVIKATGWVSELATIGVILIAMSSLFGYEYQSLSSRGEEVDAVVASKRQYTSPGRRGGGLKFHCELREVGGGGIEPDLRSGDCRPLGEGNEVRLLVDPEGEIHPVVIDGPGRTVGDSALVRVAWPATILFGLGLGVLILIGGLRNRY